MGHSVDSQRRNHQVKGQRQLHFWTSLAGSQQLKGRKRSKKKTIFKNIYVEKLLLVFSTNIKSSDNLVRLSVLLKRFPKQRDTRMGTIFSGGLIRCLDVVETNYIQCVCVWWRNAAHWCDLSEFGWLQNNMRKTRTLYGNNVSSGNRHGGQWDKCSEMFYFGSPVPK